ncbi:hypothetical protein FIBSPDRAFT_848754, partial [Athelia psychrophila]
PRGLNDSCTALVYFPLRLPSLPPTSSSKPFINLPSHSNPHPSIKRPLRIIASPPWPAAHPGSMHFYLSTLSPPSTLPIR